MLPDIVPLPVTAPLFRKIISLIKLFSIILSVRITQIAQASIFVLKAFHLNLSLLLMKNTFITLIGRCTMLIMLIPVLYRLLLY